MNGNSSLQRTQGNECMKLIIIRKLFAAVRGVWLNKVFPLRLVFYQYQVNHPFRGRGLDEDGMTYVAALRGLAVTCNFQDLTDSLIRDQIVRCTNNKKVKERLLSIDPSLEESIQLARSMEHTETWMKGIESKAHMRESAKESTIEVEQLKTVKHEKSTTSNMGEKKSFNILCYRCGCPGHIASNPVCSARTLTCRTCGRRGHSAKVCRAKGKVWNKGVKSIDNVQGEHEEEIVLTINSTFVNDFCDAESEDCVNLKRESQCELKKPHCDAILETKIVRILVDSGSLYTLISKDVYEGILKEKIEDLQTTDVKAVGYGGKRNDIVGMRWMDIIFFKGNGVLGKVYVTQERSNLLGWRHQKDLNIVLNPNATEPVIVGEDSNVEYMRIQSTTEVWREKLKGRFPKVFTEKLGKLKKFTHRIILKKNAVPVVHKVRSMPYMMREPLQQEIDRSLQEKIIKPIESSEWLAPIVVAPKDGNNICLCIDLRDLNKNIWVDRQPLPNITEMFSMMGGGKVFRWSLQPWRTVLKQR
ncbi:hypothetical protein NDU88_004066 [Pleurodeles waltl]|uniref:CCHC-type domain-containing protein n=1 Tax=Pleurodeles waltl TaxID=8319 RepID=A0AAV7WSZ8_PLEWA|nr:hypothetical protein NDU88_004066 [Pleurodeles waltl]